MAEKSKRRRSDLGKSRKLTLQNSTDNNRFDPYLTTDDNQNLQERICFWLNNQSSTNTFELREIPRDERIEIGEKRPDAPFDISTSEARSHLFRITFDMEHPYPRFMVFHREQFRKCTDLSTLEKRELVRLCLAFVKRFGFCDSFLVIPLGACDMTDTVYSTFYAYIFVENVDAYIQLFEHYAASRKIPAWPGNARCPKWVTPMWLPGSNPAVDPSCYAESVKENVSMAPNPYTPRLIKENVLLDTPPNRQRRCKSDLCRDFQLCRSFENNTIGVYSEEFIKKGCDALERYQILDFMIKKLRKHLKKNPDLPLNLVISLAAPVKMNNDRETHFFGMMCFYSNIPTFLLEAAEVDGPVLSNTIKGTVTQSDGTKIESWVLINDITLRQSNVNIVFKSQSVGKSFFQGSDILTKILVNLKLLTIGES